MSSKECGTEYRLEVKFCNSMLYSTKPVPYTCTTATPTEPTCYVCFMSFSDLESPKECVTSCTFSIRGLFQQLIDQCSIHVGLLSTLLQSYSNPYRDYNPLSVPLDVYFININSLLYIYILSFF